MGFRVVTHATHLGVILRSDSASKTDVTTRLAKARKHFKTLHQFWRHTGLRVRWKLRIYNEVFVPMLAYGMESAAITTADLHRLEALHSQSLRKTQRIPSTYCTKILTDNPQQLTVTNTGVRSLAAQHIHRAQLKLFGHVLRASPSNLERNCCFTGAFVWAEQCTDLAFHWLAHTSQAIAPPPEYPFAYLQLHRLAVCRTVWSRLVGLPTCKKLLRSTAFQAFSQ